MEPTSLNRGFTLIELLVVVAIIGILAVVIVESQKNFNNATLLTDTAYTVALSVRESQSFGLSTRAVSTAVNNAGYGVHFGDSANSYILFADTWPAGAGSPYIGDSPSYPKCPYHTQTNASLPDARPGDCVYDEPTLHDTLVSQYNFSGGYTISNICYYINSTETCKAAGSGQKIDIVYERPNTQAVMSETYQGTIKLITKALIQIKSPQNSTTCVDITSLGQISVSSTCI